METDKNVFKRETIVKTVQNPTDSQIETMISECKISPCLLCGGIPYMVGVFSPTDSRKYGAKHGHAKQFFYSICKDCVSIDDYHDTIKNRFEAFGI